MAPFSRLTTSGVFSLGKWDVAEHCLDDIALKRVGECTGQLGVAVAVEDPLEHRSEAGISIGGHNPEVTSSKFSHCAVVVGGGEDKVGQ
ncbi:MAG TPA: hypothetical protein VME44_28310 [Streptosporangiaceae bacterium]|nr:hypothetical protein [Streptosporangiaceae bacterium]